MIRVEIPEFIRIHEAIHDKTQTSVTVWGKTKPIILTGGLRSVKLKHSQYGHILFIEQNRSKDSSYAARARKGEHITWGIRTAQSWILFDNQTKLSTS